MTTLDILVLLFGVLVSGLVGAGFVLTVYGRAFSEQAMREASALDARMPSPAQSLADATEPRST